LSLASRRSTRLEDPGAQLLDRLTGFWDQYGRLSLGVLGLVVAVGLITFFVLRQRAASEEQAAGKLAEANVLFWQNDYARSLQVAKQVADQFPNTPSGIEAHRLTGDDAYWTGDFKSAAAEYRRYLDHVKTGLLANAARRSLGYALESGHQFKEAASTYEGLVGTFDRESSAELLLAVARCDRLAGQPQEAVKAIQRLLDEYGETSASNRARIELAELGAQAH